MAAPETTANNNNNNNTGAANSQQQPPPQPSQPTNNAETVTTTQSSNQQPTDVVTIPTAKIPAEKDWRMQWMLGKLTQIIGITAKQFYECLKLNNNKNLNELAAMLNSDIKQTSVLFSAKHNAQVCYMYYIYSN